MVSFWAKYVRKHSEQTIQVYLANSTWNTTIYMNIARDALKLLNPLGQNFSSLGASPLGMKFWPAEFAISMHPSQCSLGWLKA